MIILREHHKKFKEDYAQSKREYDYLKGEYDRKEAGYQNVSDRAEKEYNNANKDYTTTSKDFINNHLYGLYGIPGMDHNLMINKAIVYYLKDNGIPITYGFDFANGNIVDILKGAIEYYEKDLLPEIEQLDKKKGVLDTASKKYSDIGWSRFDRSSKKLDAYNKAVSDWKKENPVSEGKYAIWHSKNGDRKVTVITVDEPNKRAKINTDKGATMYVPLANLEPDFKEYNKDLKK